VFHEVAYKAHNREHLVAGLDEFLDLVTVLPPGEWDPAIRIEPPSSLPSQVATHCHVTSLCTCVSYIAHNTNNKAAIQA
jgi:hypothetical protein